ncbi:MAG: metallophosphoesterase [Gemmatimonadota bacterium]
MLPVVEYVTAHVLRSSRLAGYRIAVIGDFHLAPWRSERALTYAIDVINAHDPDLCALVGDYGYSTEMFPPVSRLLYRTVIGTVTRELARLHPRDGVYAVLGNHDVDAGADDVSAALARSGVHVLRDAHSDVIRGGGVLRVFGSTDIARDGRGVADVSQVGWRDIDAGLVLSHHPDIVVRQRAGPIPPYVTVLAGHTHGGQISFPLVGAPVTLSRAATRHFPAGFVPNEAATLYVTRGLGEQIPLRVRATREVTLLELAKR